MAKARGLDLNNVYRINRRFKNSPFVVLKYDTIQEVTGIQEPDKRTECIKKMLCPLAALTSQPAMKDDNDLEE